MAIGSVIGALYSARSEHPRIRLLAYSALGFGVAGVIASLMPNIWLFGISLVALGATAQTFTISTNSLVQLRTDPALRGRVMAIYMAIFMGCTPLGAPLIGWIADLYGPRWAIAIGAASGFIAATIGLGFHLLRKSRTQTKTPT
jgi:MFS family permease